MEPARLQGQTGAGPAQATLAEALSPGRARGAPSSPTPVAPRQHGGALPQAAPPGRGPQRDPGRRRGGPARKKRAAPGTAPHLESGSRDPGRRPCRGAAGGAGRARGSRAGGCAARGLGLGVVQPHHNTASHAPHPRQRPQAGRGQRQPPRPTRSPPPRVPPARPRRRQGGPRCARPGRGSGRASGCPGSGHCPLRRGFGPARPGPAKERAQGRAGSRGRARRGLSLLHPAGHRQPEQAGNSPRGSQPGPGKPAHGAGAGAGAAVARAPPPPPSPAAPLSHQGTTLPISTCA